MTLCKSTVPILIGLARAMGRASTQDPPLLCRIFPAPSPPEQNTVESQCSKKNAFTVFRPIIPRSLSMNFPQHPDSGMLQEGSLTDGKTASSKRSSIQSQQSVHYDCSTYFFSKHGSCFGRVTPLGCSELTDLRNPLQFSIVHLQAILSLVKIAFSLMKKIIVFIGFLVIEDFIIFTSTG